MMNIDRFKKLMMVTTSPVEGEALSALRMANKMLAQENLTWDKFIGKVSLSSSSFSFDDIIKERTRQTRANPRPTSPSPNPGRKQRPVKASEPFKKKIFKIRRD